MTNSILVIHPYKWHGIWVPHDCSYQKIRTCGYEVQALYRGALPSFSFDIRNPYKGTKVSESEWDLR